MYNVSRTKRPRHVTRGWLHKCRCSERGNITNSMCFHHDCKKSMGCGSNPVLQKERKVTLGPPDLQDLTPAILREFSSSTETLSTRQDDIEWCTARTIEAQDQDKFYRCFNKRAGRGVPV